MRVRIGGAMRRAAFWVVLPGLSGLALAQQVQPAKSAMSFTIKQMGVPVEGRFKAFDAVLAFDPKQAQAGSVSFGIEMASAEIGDAETTKELRKPEWFDTAKHPKATFTSTAIKVQAEGRYEVSGKLAIKGIARDIVVPVQLLPGGAERTAQGQFTLKRSDFKIGQGEWADTSIVADDVVVKFRLAVAGMNTP